MRRSRGKQGLLALPVLALLLLQLFPIAVILLTSFKTPYALLKEGPLTAHGFFWGNYLQVLRDDAFFIYLRNSALIGAMSTSASLLCGTMAAYALSRFRFGWRAPITLMVLCARMVPPVTLAIPLFVVFRMLNLTDTLVGLALAHTSMNLPMAIWLLIPFFDAIPQELEEAALLDGCNRWQVFFKVMLPLVRPGVMVTGIFCFLVSWNDFLFSLILAGSNTKTATLAVNSYLTAWGADWGPMTASSVLVLLPAFFFAASLQKHVVSGVSAGGVKG